MPERSAVIGRAQGDLNQTIGPSDKVVLGMHQVFGNVLGDDRQVEIIDAAHAMAQQRQAKRILYPVGKRAFYHCH